MGLLLGPGGEFAFIVIGLAMAAGIMTGEIGGLLLTVVALSMSAIPVFALGERLARSLEKAEEARAAELDAVPPEDIEPHAIVVGCGRVGELVARDAAHARRPPRRDGAQSGRRGARARAATTCSSATPRTRSSCAAAGWETARALVITIRARGEIDDIIAVARGLRPELMIVSRARDADHARHLYAEGVSDAVPETIEASLQLRGRACSASAFQRVR